MTNLNWFIFVVLLITWAQGQSIGDKIESIQGKNDFNPNIITARMYDYSTDTIAYKDKLTKKCYIQRMQKLRPVPLYISAAKSDTQEVEILAGRGIARFCQGMEVYKLLVQIK